MKAATAHRGRSVIYLRVSSDDQTKGISLTVQERDCRAWCDTAGIEIAATFKEPESAKSDERPEFQKAVRFCASNRDQVTHFVIWKLDRFARVALDTLSYRAAIAKAGVRLVSVLEPAIGLDPVGKLVTTMLAGVAEYDNDAKSERVVACMSRLLEDGYWTHRAPLGYTLARDGDRPTLAHDPVTAPLIAQAFETIARGEVTPAQAMRTAQRAGLRTKGGQTLSPSTWYSLMASPVYCGRIKTRMTRGKTYRGRWEPIVSPETWARAQAVIRGDKVGRTQCRDTNRWPLRGFLRCPCGLLLTASVSRGRSGPYAYYHCRHSGAGHARVKSADADGPVIDAALAHVARIAAPLVAIARHHVAQVAGLAVQTEAVAVEARRKQVAEIERKQARLLDAMLSGRIPEDVFAARSAGFERELAELRDQLKEGTGPATPMAQLQAGVEIALRDLPATVRAIEPGSRIELLRALWPDGLTLPARGTAAAPEMPPWPAGLSASVEAAAPLVPVAAWRAEGGKRAAGLSDPVLLALDRVFDILARVAVATA